MRIRCENYAIPGSCAAHIHSGQKNLNSSARAPMGVAAMPASMRSSSYACCLRRAAAEGVVTEMPPAPLDAWTVPAMPSGPAGALTRDGGGRRLPAHDPRLGAPSTARNEAPQPMWNGRSGTTLLSCNRLQIN